MRAAILGLGLCLGLVAAGCASKAPTDLGAAVAYPRVGDVATYDLTGAYVELARWENGHTATQVSFAVASAPKALDGARQLVDAYRVTTTLGGAKHADLYVSPAHTHSIVQAVYPLSQDQSVVAFDERGFPWLFGASTLFGHAFTGGDVTFAIPDTLAASGAPRTGAWIQRGDENGLWKFDLQLDGATGSLWMKPGSAWPQRAHLAIADARLAPLVRADAPLPVRMDATLRSLTQGADFLPPRDSSKQYGADDAAKRVAWSGEAPPDGDTPATPYALADAMRDAKLLDKGVQDWLATAQDPRLYRATFKLAPVNETGPLNSTLAPYWLLEWMEKGGKYYVVEMQRLDAPVPFPAAPLPGGPAAPPGGVPRVLSSGAAQPPADPTHGWFPKDAEPEKLVPLSEAVKIVRSTFGASGIQIFVRSFASPPGYAYFIDGGWDAAESKRYTVVYEPGAGFLQEATGPVSARLAS